MLTIFLTHLKELTIYYEERNIVYIRHWHGRKGTHLNETNLYVRTDLMRQNNYTISRQLNENHA